MAPAFQEIVKSSPPWAYMEITQAMDNTGLNVRAIMQWWLKRDGEALQNDFPRYNFNYRPHSPVMTASGWGGAQNRSIWLSATGVDMGAYVVTNGPSGPLLGHYTVRQNSLLQHPIQQYGITGMSLRPETEEEQNLFCSTGLLIAVVNPTPGIISPFFKIASPNCQ